MRVKYGIQFIIIMELKCNIHRLVIVTISRYNFCLIYNLCTIHIRTLGVKNAIRICVF